MPVVPLQCFDGPRLRVVMTWIDHYELIYSEISIIVNHFSIYNCTVVYTILTFFLWLPSFSFSLVVLPETWCLDVEWAAPVCWTLVTSQLHVWRVVVRGSCRIVYLKTKTQFARAPTHYFIIWNVHIMLCISDPTYCLVSVFVQCYYQRVLTWL